MSANDKPGFLITQGRIALALSLITLLTLGYQGSKAVLDVHYRLASLEEKWVSMEGTQRDLANEMRALNTTMTEFNLTMRELQVRQQGARP